MKSFIIGLVTVFSASAFCGTLVNSKTGESFELALNETNSTVSITSRVAGVSNKVVLLKSLSASDDNHEELFLLTKWGMDEFEGMQYVPPLTPFGIALNVLDLLYVPFAKTSDLVKNKTEQKAFKILMLAITSDQTVAINNKLFKRVKSNLSKLE